ncbi:ABC transporter permease [Bacillus taeanensis]|uniref:Iron export ABC transporter permease subunit FetB n=1 Tax=Bacillus taeanensis TaxID=273032 RepID=A0A366XXE2_9BACI|nr:iron export ABC transporter permease subunit FetB [Bacillus taeanensis]RBW70567.1 iron export ABC transporter permease subunit FetB [Bacillus taeanensis]
MTTITNASLLTMIVFVMIPVSLSMFFVLGLSKSILWSSLRGVLQLFLIGYILTFLFSIDDWKGIGMMLAVMLSVATYHAGKRGESLPYIYVSVFLILFLIEALVLSLWLLFDLIPFQAEQVIPMSGMIIGNGMVAVGLSLERMKSEFQEQRGRIMAALSLGAKPHQASKVIVKRTLKAAMIPNIDGLKTIGLVQLPGMMTGLILGGASPIEAIRYQIVVSLSIFSSVSICAMLVTIVMYRFFFNKQMQLIYD